MVQSRPQHEMHGLSRGPRQPIRRVAKSLNREIAKSATCLLFLHPGDCRVPTPLGWEFQQTIPLCISGGSTRKLQTRTAVQNKRRHTLGPECEGAAAPLFVVLVDHRRVG